MVTLNLTKEEAQLVSHYLNYVKLSTDKFENMTGKKVNVIIRVGVGSTSPLDPGIQHRNDYTQEFKSILQFTKIWELKNSNDIYKIYTDAYNKGGVHIIVEWPELYYQN
jgi:hypothetical protein